MTIACYVFERKLISEKKQVESQRFGKTKIKTKTVTRRETMEELLGRINNALKNDRVINIETIYTPWYRGYGAYVGENYYGKASEETVIVWVEEVD